MPTKKHSTKVPKTPEIPQIPEAEIAEESRPSHPRQIVEVVIEEDGATGEPVSAEVAIVERPEREEESSVHVMENEEDGQKRKEMVGELFQPKQEEVPATRPERPEEVEMPDEEPAIMPEITMHKKSTLKPMLMWAAIVIVVAGLTGGGLLMFLNKGVSTFPSITIAPTPTPTQAPQPTATPTPAPVDKKAVAVEVLNGSGEKGVALKMKSVLEEAGYTVKKMGNAENFSFEKTEIHVKADKEEYLEALAADLKDSYTIETKAADLDEDSAYDVQIIIGKE